MHACPHVTAGVIALSNLESSRHRSWAVLQRWPDRTGTAERIVEEEHHRSQFLGDATALDRLIDLSADLRDSQPRSAESFLVAARVAAMVHHFADAMAHLATAETLGACTDAVSRIRLSIHQARGENFDTVLATRRAMADASCDLQDLVPLAALLADFGEYEEADQTYLKAIWNYRDVSPFALAWVCFQLGVLWGETVPSTEPERAADWYRQAIDYLPFYTHARVHLAELCLDREETNTAELLLQPIIDSGDPEVNWRLSQVLEAQGRNAEAEHQRLSACSMFEAVLARHELAFADHGAEFYLSSGASPSRARELALVNLANRPTLRAFELAHAAARASCDGALAISLLGRAREKFATVRAFAGSTLSGSSHD